MSQENVTVAKELFDAVRRQDLPRLIELTDPDVEWYSFFSLGEAGDVYRGHSGLERYAKDLGEAWETVSPDFDGAVEVGSVVVLVGKVHYRGRGSGVEDESPSGWMLKFRQGKVACFRAFQQPEQALEAVGLRE